MGAAVWLTNDYQCKAAFRAATLGARDGRRCPRGPSGRLLRRRDEQAQVSHLNLSRRIRRRPEPERGEPARRESSKHGVAALWSLPRVAAGNFRGSPGAVVCRASSKTSVDDDGAVRQGVGGSPESVELIEKEKRGGSAASRSRARRDRSCPGGFGVIATLLLRTPGTRSPWNPVRLSSQLVAWSCELKWWSARSRISGALAVAERIGLSVPRRRAHAGRSAVERAPPAPARRPRPPGCARSGAWKRRPASAPGPSATADCGR